jgi:hypothetical protein
MAAAKVLRRGEAAPCIGRRGVDGEDRLILARSSARVILPGPHPSDAESGVDVGGVFERELLVDLRRFVQLPRPREGACEAESGFPVRRIPRHATPVPRDRLRGSICPGELVREEKRQLGLE